MANYKMVLLRFNMDKDEAILYKSLDKINRAGHVKNILRQAFIYNNIKNMNEPEILSLILYAIKRK